MNRSIIRFGWDKFGATLTSIVGVPVTEVPSGARFSRRWAWGDGRALEIYVRRSTQEAQESYPAKDLNASPCPHELGDTCFVQAFHDTLVWTHRNLELFLSGGALDELASDALHIQEILCALPLSEPAPQIEVLDDEVLVCQIGQPIEASLRVVGSLDGYIAAMVGPAILLEFTAQSIRFEPRAVGLNVVQVFLEDESTSVMSHYAPFSIDCRATLDGEPSEVASRYCPNMTIGTDGALIERPDEGNTTWMVHEVLLPSATLRFAFSGPLRAAAPRSIAMRLSDVWLESEGQKSRVPAKEFALRLGRRDSDLSGALVVYGQEYRLS